MSIMICMSDKDYITAAKQDMVDYIYDQDGVSLDEIKNEFDISESTVRSYIHDVRSKFSVDTIINKDGYYRLTDVSIVSKDSKEDRDRKLSQVSTRKITEDLKEFFKEEEKKILEELQNRPSRPVETKETENGKDVLITLSDLHMGEKYDPEFDEYDHERDYSKQKAGRVPLKLFEKVKPELNKIDNIDNIHLCLLGDIVDGRAIYPKQQWEQNKKASIRNQINWMTMPVWNLIKYLEPYCKTLNVVGVKGNHGQIKLKTSDADANLDLFLYDRLKFMLRGSDIDSSVNINLVDGFRNFFDVRNSTVMLIHGQNTKTHLDDTSSSKGNWRGWLNKWDYDIAYRGHYHQYRVQPILNGIPVVMSPSPAPGGMFADKIGDPDISEEYKLGTMSIFDDDGHIYNRCFADDNLEYLDVAEVDYTIDEILD